MIFIYLLVHTKYDMVPIYCSTVLYRLQYLRNHILLNYIYIYVSKSKLYFMILSFNYTAINIKYFNTKYLSFGCNI